MNKYQQQLSEVGQGRDHEKGQLILHQGDQPQYINYLSQGFVKVYDIDEDGNQKLLMILKEGDMFPFFWTFNSISAVLYFYEALTDIKLVQITPAQLDQLRQENGGFTTDVVEYLTHNLHDLMYSLQAVSSRNAKEKIQNLLPYLAHRCGTETKKGVFELDLKLTQQEIADMAGLTRETTSKILKEFMQGSWVKREEGFLTINVGKMPEQDNHDWGQIRTVRDGE